VIAQRDVLYKKKICLYNDGYMQGKLKFYYAEEEKKKREKKITLFFVV